MQNDETTVETQDTQTEGQPEVVEETTAEETTNDSQSGSDEVTPEALAHAQAEAAKYRRLFEKSQKPQAPVAPKAPQTASPLNVEETVLLANGMSEELLAELKAVAAVRKIGLIKAQTDPIFVAVKERMEKEKKQNDASLPASRGSGSVKVRKTVSTPGLTREEHKALVLGR